MASIQSRVVVEQPTLFSIVEHHTPTGVAVEGSADHLRWVTTRDGGASPLVIGTGATPEEALAQVRGSNLMDQVSSYRHDVGTTGGWYFGIGERSYDNGIVAGKRTEQLLPFVVFQGDDGRYHASPSSIRDVSKPAPQWWEPGAWFDHPGMPEVGTRMDGGALDPETYRNGELVKPAKLPIVAVSDGNRIARFEGIDEARRGIVELVPEGEAFYRAPAKSFVEMAAIEKAAARRTNILASVGFAAAAAVGIGGWLIYQHNK